MHIVTAATMVYIKSFIFFACVFAIAFTDAEGKGLVQRAVDLCALKYNFPADEYEDFVADDLNVKLDDCVAACAMKTLETMTEEGIFTGNDVKKIIRATGAPKEEIAKFNAVVDKCVAQYGKGGRNHCQIVKNLRSCYEVAVPEYMNDPESLYGSINQILLLTLENYPHSQ